MGIKTFGREQYVEKFTGLAEEIASKAEISRFLAKATGLAELDFDAIGGLNPVADAIDLKYTIRDQRGIF